MSQFAIIGGGALGLQFKAFLQNAFPRASFIFFDDNLAKDKTYTNAYRFDGYDHDDFRDYTFFIGLGYKHLEKKIEILSHLQALGRKQTVFIHPSCFVNPSATIGKGSFIYPMANIDKSVQIGRGCLINNSVVISHDSQIGDGCYLSPSVTICGQVELGECAFIGAGTVISNGVKIGKNAVIGLGSVVNKDVPDNCSAVGNPIRILNKRLILR